MSWSSDYFFSASFFIFSDGEDHLAGEHMYFRGEATDLWISVKSATWLCYLNIIHPLKSAPALVLTHACDHRAHWPCLCQWGMRKRARSWNARAAGPVIRVLYYLGHYCFCITLNFSESPLACLQMRSLDSMILNVLGVLIFSSSLFSARYQALQVHHPLRSISKCFGSLLSTDKHITFGMRGKKGGLKTTG